MTTDNDPTGTEPGQSLTETVEITEHDWDAADHAIVTIVEAVADCLNTTSENLPRLGTVIDADALVSLLRPGEQSEYSKLSVSFEYAACRVTVRRNGIVRIEAGPGRSSV